MCLGELGRFSHYSCIPRQRTAQTSLWSATECPFRPVTLCVSACMRVIHAQLKYWTPVSDKKGKKEEARQKSGLDPCRLPKSPLLAWCKPFLPWVLVFWMVCCAEAQVFKCNHFFFLRCIIVRGIPERGWREPLSWENHMGTDRDVSRTNSQPFISVSFLPQRHKLWFYPGPVT